MIGTATPGTPPDPLFEKEGEKKQGKQPLYNRSVFSH
jgi:hypothetical protein